MATAAVGQEEGDRAAENQRRPGVAVDEGGGRGDGPLSNRKATGRQKFKGDQDDRNDGYGPGGWGGDGRMDP